MRGYHEAFQGASVTDYDTACVNGINSPSCAAFLNEKIGEYTDEQMARKDNTMANVLYTAKRVFDADKNSSYTLIRNADLLTTKDFVQSYNNSIANGIQHDVDVTKRQFEINEYHYYNKLDTLFFLQLFFIATLTMAILIYFNRRGALSTQMTGMITGGLAILLVIVGVSRYFYTIRTRDRRLWNRRYFQTEAEPRPDLITTCDTPSSTTTINLNALFDKEDIQCAMDTNAAYKAWKDAAKTEAENQMAGVSTPASIFAAGLTKPQSCKRQ